MHTVGRTGIGSFVTSTPAKIEAVSEMPGRRSCSSSAGKWSRCRNRWSFFLPSHVPIVIHLLCKCYLFSLTYSSTISDLHCHRSTHHITTRQVFGRRSITFHETLALSIRISSQVIAFQAMLKINTSELRRIPPSPLHPSVMRQPAP
jgi:hypothetical protein